jgi:Arc/MetJ family transcription regulator
MTRTNIDIDDELVADVMRRYNLKTKREAVDFALRKVAGPRLTPQDILSLEGIGWDGDLDEIRRDRTFNWPADT